VALAVKGYQERLINENWRQNNSEWKDISAAATSGDPGKLHPLVHTIEADMQKQSFPLLNTHFETLYTAEETRVAAADKAAVCHESTN